MSRGFTLVEIVIVLGLLGVIAAVAVPAFARLDVGDEATRAAGDLAPVLHAARAKALARATTAAVLIDPAGGRYWMSLDESLATGDSGAFVLPPGVTLIGREPRARFRFLATGAAVGDSLFLRGPTRTAIVSVDPWTGDVRITSR